MKKIVIVFAVFIYVLKGIAQEIDRSTRYEIKILEKLVVDITRKRHPIVFFDGLNKRKISLLERYSTLRRTNNMSEADFVFVKNKNKPFTAYKPTLALDFTSLKNCNYCIGVFSWKNGRPILILFEENLERFNILLPKEYRYFIESKSMVIGRK